MNISGLVQLKINRYFFKLQIAIEMANRAVIPGHFVALS